MWTMLYLCETRMVSSIPLCPLCRGERLMLEPTLERLPVRFRLGEHESGTLFIICEPMQTPTATDHPLLSRGSITFTFREGTTLEQATDMAQLMDERLAEMNCLHLQLNPP